MFFNFLIPPNSFSSFPEYVAFVVSLSYALNATLLLLYSRIFGVEVKEKAFIPVTLSFVAIDFTSIQGLRLFVGIPAYLGVVILTSLCILEGLALALTSSLALVNASRRHLAATWIAANVASSGLFMAFVGVS
ncbi:MULTISPECIES: hypothetical protein [Archaeoglobus]|jgi:hypothetical protein|uniref:Uncharacterized protein AF_2164 n=3 Tax=Archaeoglobus fulgidus TaxID=2234 RepID=Y2164_ARCFU|nr:MULTISPECIES: hypothetical protein [Archaeoglobus]O28118.1 RecName: Full=Uncharacterized protein AF_2164 [Archaeoglobus fulgidus DSM 4304]AAB89096.1 predicted coding region AF_2164 [Archaeoglobus fulgidus DSM 4304]AIG99152.1 hypothetical protein AFULGI_00024350 [Archaeoglobus fulgidus DSM 8774]KUJ92958.1 MAG: hypothetical protein XD40_1829 [Archaeoglobus fulgidus]KUK06455.1 MAG: Uncharacterized protein XD48_1328 [Archaeoglobus fulgidus]MDI3498198.1 hypothetical protein [Archaeoglobus sp.]